MNDIEEILDQIYDDIYDDDYITAMQLLEPYYEERSEEKASRYIIEKDLRHLDFDILDEFELYFTFFEKCNLSGMELPQMELIHCGFAESDLSDVVIKEGYLKGCEVRDTNLQRSVLNEITINFSTFNRCDFGKCKILSDGYFIGLEETTLFDVKIKECSFYSTTIEIVLFSQCKIENTAFSDSVMKNVRFIGCTFENVDFTGVDFSKVIFIYCKFTSCSFSTGQKIFAYKSLFDEESKRFIQICQKEYC